MSSNIKMLRSLIRKELDTLNEGASDKMYLTVENEEVHFGSKTHLTELDSTLSSLKNVRKQLSRADRKERDRITRCMESIRHLRKKAHRHGLDAGHIKLIEESED